MNLKSKLLFSALLPCALMVSSVGAPQDAAPAAPQAATTTGGSQAPTQSPSPTGQKTQSGGGDSQKSDSSSSTGHASSSNSSTDKKGKSANGDSKKVQGDTAADKDKDKKGKTTNGKDKAKNGKKAKPVKPKPEKKPWQYFKLPAKKILLDFTDANVDKTLSMFIRASGVTIVKDPSFKGPITLNSAKEVTLDEAFSILNTTLSFSGFEIQKRDNLLVVAKPVPLPPPAPVVGAPGPPPVDNAPILKTYKLKNANAREVARIVNEVFTPQSLTDLLQQLQQAGGNAQQMMMMRMQMGQQQQQPPKTLRASFDEYTNAVVVTASKKDQDDVAALIKDLDTLATTPLVTEFFHIKSVPAQDVVDAVTDVLNANAPTGRGAGGGNNNDQNQGYPFFFFDGGNNNQRTKLKGQTVTVIKATNSILISTTAENMDLVKKIIDEIDKPSNYADTTFVIRLKSAKATDLATLLNNVFTTPRTGGQYQSNYYFGDYNGNDRTKIPTDLDDAGNVVNVRDLTGKVNIIADPNTNSLVVVTMPSNFPMVKKIVDKLDQVADQVLIETVIVEANLDATTKLGVEFNFATGKSMGSQNFGLQSTNATTPLQGFTYTLTAGQYAAFLNTLETDTRFKILDTPRISTSNNVQATIDVGQKVPYITGQEATGIGTSLISTFDFLDVGVQLKVTPRLSSSDQVSMDVAQTADDLEGYTSYNAPLVDHREADTTVTVKDGETVILGGIIQHSTTTTVNKIPILGDIPLLGLLFQSSSKENAQTELMVLLTPHIIHNSEDAKKLREDETKELSKGSQQSIKDTIHQKP
jgi:general secretion pathway protein D